MNSLGEALLGLPYLERVEPAGCLGSFWNPVGGLLAFQGALRIFAWSEDAQLYSASTWNADETWRSSYRELLSPKWQSIAEDAFGTQYLLHSDTGRMALFWSETGEVEELEADPEQFFRAIIAEPDSTIWLGFYSRCVMALGKPSPKQHFALKVESAVGGEHTTDNVLVMDATTHMRALGQLAHQIRDVPIGTPLEPQAPLPMTDPSKT